MHYGYIIVNTTFTSSKLVESASLDIEIIWIYTNFVTIATKLTDKSRKTYMKNV